MIRPTTRATTCWAYSTYELLAKLGNMHKGQQARRRLHTLERRKPLERKA